MRAPAVSWRSKARSWRSVANAATRPAILPIKAAFADTSARSGPAGDGARHDFGVGTSLPSAVITFLNGGGASVVAGTALADAPAAHTRSPTLG